MNQVARESHSHSHLLHHHHILHRNAGSAFKEGKSIKQWYIFKSVWIWSNFPIEVKHAISLLRVIICAISCAQIYLFHTIFWLGGTIPQIACTDLYFSHIFPADMLEKKIGALPEFCVNWEPPQADFFSLCHHILKCTYPMMDKEAVCRLLMLSLSWSS